MIVMPGNAVSTQGYAYTNATVLCAYCKLMIGICYAHGTLYYSFLFRCLHGKLYKKSIIVSLMDIRNIPF